MHPDFSTSRGITPRARLSARTAGSSAACAGTTPTDRVIRSSTASSRWRRARPAHRVGGHRRPQRVRRDRHRRLARARQATDVRGRLLDHRRAGAAGARATPPPAGIGDVDDLLAGVEMGIDTFDCAMPTRLGRHGVALIPDPAARWRVDLVKSRWREASEPILDGCPCPACAGGQLTRLPPLPAARRRADPDAARHPPQPELHRLPDGRPAGGDRRRSPGRRRGRAAVGRRSRRTAPVAARPAVVRLRAPVARAPWPAPPRVLGVPAPRPPSRRTRAPAPRFVRLLRVLIDQAPDAVDRRLGVVGHDLAECTAVCEALVARLIATATITAKMMQKMSSAMKRREARFGFRGATGSVAAALCGRGARAGSRA